jgi:pimeloyl-ACP methyl ester carboxylesterase
MPTKYMDVSGYATYYYYRGATTLPDVVPDFSRGRKILFIHGAGSNGHTWHRQGEAIGEHHSAIALDLPGHGRSAGVEGLSTVADYADFVIAFLDKLQIKSTIILGHSMGGAIAMELALRHSPRVEALILSCTAAQFNISAERIDALRAITMGRAPQAFNTEGYSPKTVKENFDVVREGWMEQAKTDPRVRYTDIVACSNVDLREQISKIEKPTLIIAGADDQGTTPADAEFMAGKILGAKKTIVADAGHFIPRERPAEYNSAIEEFVASLKQESR